MHKLSLLITSVIIFLRVNDGLSNNPATILPPTPNNPTTLTAHSLSQNCSENIEIEQQPCQTTVSSKKDDSNLYKTHFSSTPYSKIRAAFDSLPPRAMGRAVSNPQNNQDTDGPSPMGTAVSQTAPFPEEYVTTPGEWEPTTHQSQPPSIFDQMRKPGMAFVEKIIELEKQLCKRSCDSSPFPSASGYSYGQFQCKLCYCDQMCVVLHNCCPDVLLRKIASHDEGQGSKCLPTTPVVPREKSEIKLIPMVTTCPKLTENSGKSKDSDFQMSPDVVKSRCENVHPYDALQQIPVSARDTKITYRNIYCAQCNDVNVTNEESFLQWKSSIKCEAGIEKLLSGNANKSEIFRRLNTQEDVTRTGCWMEYFLEESGFEKKCKQLEYPIIKRCNQTGKWDIYDAGIERACNMYTAVVFRRYKNMFCYLCNTGLHGVDLYHLEELLDSGRTDFSRTDRLSFQALLDFSESYGSGGSKTEEIADGAVCEERQIYDNITCECRDVVCNAGKEISQSDTSKCTSAIKSNFFGQSICFQFDLEFADGRAHKIDKIISETLNGLHRMYSGRNVLFVILTARYWCPWDNNMSLNFEILDYSEFGFRNMNELDQRAIYLFNLAIKDAAFWFPPYLKSHEISLKTNCPKDYTVSRPCRKDRNLKVFGERREYGRMSTEADIMKNVQFHPFRFTNGCPHVDLPADEFEEIITDSVISKAGSIKIGSERVDKIDNMTWRVCRDVFLDILSSVNQSECFNHSSNRSYSEDFDKATVEGLLSVICTSLSLFCLSLTFLTYMVFKSLRDVSGKNIMTLTVTLFFAQAFFEFAVEQFENKTACIIFGVLIHYFWLAAVFSMNACTVERFYKLCFPLRSRAFFYSSKPFIVALLYTLLSPLIIVGINILINYETTGEIGYGNPRMCYINKVYSRVLAFALPLAILLTTNLVLFALTVHTIRRQRVPGHTSSSTRIGIKACVQLSFVTGLTWLLAFLYEFITVPALGYVFTALIGLQGVMFFYSIIVNRRVMALYKGLVASKIKGKSNTSTSGSSISKEVKKDLSELTKTTNCSDSNLKSEMS